MSVLAKYKWDFKWVLQEHNQAIHNLLSLFYRHVFLFNYVEYF